MGDHLGSFDNSVDSICKYCGSPYSRRQGNHICDEWGLEILIGNERGRSGKVDLLRRRQREVREFRKKYPDYSGAVSQHMPP